MPSAFQRVIALAILIPMMTMGPILLLIDAALFARNVLFIHSAVRTQGTIVGLKESRSSRSGRHSYAPVFRFAAEDGQTYTVDSHMFNSPPAFAFGERVTVLYEKGHPSHASIDTLFQLWIPEVVLTIVGGGFAVLPALVLYRRMRQPQS